MKPLVWMVVLLLLPASAAAQHEGMAMPAPPAAAPAAPAAAPAGGPGQLPPEQAEVTLPEDRQQLIGLRTAKAARATLTGAVRASAVVAADETRLSHVHSKLMGWVQKLHVRSVGERVVAGQALYSLYSQELFAAQQEYLRARATNPELGVAARQRLRLWDVPDDQVALIEQKGPQRSILFRAPRAGTVIEKSVVEGHFVEAEMMLYAIADLSQVWVLAEVYEFEVARLDPAGSAEIQLQGGAAPLEAPVGYIYPTVDARTRTVRVRMVVPNPDGELRPGTFATVLLPARPVVGSSRVDLQACKLEYSIVSPK